jgi:L-Ala-D/L-Glu epimerase
VTVRFQRVRLTKLHPLQISRGTSTGSWNLFMLVSDGSHEGVGECAPGTGFDDTLAAEAEAALKGFAEDTARLSDPFTSWREMHRAGIDPAAMAALDVALWDLLGKRAGLPLHVLLGLPEPAASTSVTAGINPPEVVRERADEFLGRTGAKHLKLKLGNPEGREADRAAFVAASEVAARHGASVRVDANGGWSADEAIEMSDWLAERGCDYVEQPLPAGNEDELPAVFAVRRLPIFLDESIKTSRDVVAFADRCDGVNLKLMKTGGVTEALRLVATARAHGLQTMIGCMGESSVAISAGASLGALFDHIDLDSHLNLNPDPAEGAGWRGGVVVPSGKPGHGATLREHGQ